jgi:putative aldouronate transport system permease protein
VLYRKKTGWARFFQKFRRDIPLTAMALPGTLLVFVFAYLPMPGIVIAFQNFKARRGLFGSPWVGFENFKFLFGTDIAIRITRNTVGLNLLFIFTGLVTAVTIAILLSEIRNGLLIRFYQSALFFPTFISWVIASYFVFALLSHEHGLINNFLERAGRETISWYQEPRYWPIILMIAHIWKGVGYASLIYLAAIIAISPELYEAARIDGASKWQEIWHITLPHLMTVIVLLTLLAIGRIFRADFGLFFFYRGTVAPFTRQQMLLIRLCSEH